MLLASQIGPKWVSRERVRANAPIRTSEGSRNGVTLCCIARWKATSLILKRVAPSYGHDSAAKAVATGRLQRRRRFSPTTIRCSGHLKCTSRLFCRSRHHSSSSSILMGQPCVFVAVRRYFGLQISSFSFTSGNLPSTTALVVTALVPHFSAPPPTTHLPTHPQFLPHFLPWISRVQQRVPAGQRLVAFSQLDASLRQWAACVDAQTFQLRRAATLLFLIETGN